MKRDGRKELVTYGLPPYGSTIKDDAEAEAIKDKVAELLDPTKSTPPFICGTPSDENFVSTTDITLWSLLISDTPIGHDALLSPCT